MLARPTRVSAAAASQDGKPRSARKAGRWTAMKARWKPHTKKPAVSSQKLGIRRASSNASRTVCCVAPGSAGAGRPATPAASGTIISAVAARMVRLATQPAPWIRALTKGRAANWPIDPPIEAMPSARLRFSGGAARPTVPRMTEKPQPLSPSPIRLPPRTSWPPSPPRVITISPAA